jgi:hypothetical protein
LSPGDRTSALYAFASSQPNPTERFRDGSRIEVDPDLFRVYAMLNPHVYAILSYERSTETSFEELLSRYGAFRHRSFGDDSSTETDPGLHDVLSAASRAARLGAQQWRSSLEPWSDFVESVRRTWGDQPRAFCLAAIGAGIKSKDSRAAGFPHVLDATQPLVERARYARLKPGVTWWRSAIKGAASQEDRIWIVVLLLSWAPGGVIRTLSNQVQALLQEMPQASWAALLNTVQVVIMNTTSGRKPVTGIDEAFVSGIKSERFKALLLLRLPRALAARSIADLFLGVSQSDQDLSMFVAARGIAESYRDPKTWRGLLAFLQTNYVEHDIPDNGPVPGAEVFYYSRPEGIPAALMQQVVDNQTVLPFVVLEAAESGSGRRPGIVLEPLGTVAQAENWFN